MQAQVAAPPADFAKRHTDMVEALRVAGASFTPGAATVTDDRAELPFQAKLELRALGNGPTRGCCGWSGGTRPLAGHLVTGHPAPRPGRRPALPADPDLAGAGADPGRRRVRAGRPRAGGDGQRRRRAGQGPGRGRRRPRGPRPDPGQGGRSALDEAFNRAIHGRYPPGSSFKVVTPEGLVRGGRAARTRRSCPASRAPPSGASRSRTSRTRRWAHPVPGRLRPLVQHRLRDPAADGCPTTLAGGRRPVRLRDVVRRRRATRWRRVPPARRTPPTGPRPPSARDGCWPAPCTWPRWRPRWPRPWRAPPLAGPPAAGGPAVALDPPTAASRRPHAGGGAHRHGHRGRRPRPGRRPARRARPSSATPTRPRPTPGSSASGARWPSPCWWRAAASAARWRPRSPPASSAASDRDDCTVTAPGRSRRCMAPQDRPASRRGDDRCEARPRRLAQPTVFRGQLTAQVGLDRHRRLPAPAPGQHGRPRRAINHALGFANWKAAPPRTPSGRRLTAPPAPWLVAIRKAR